MSITPSYEFVPSSRADSMNLKEVGPAFPASRMNKEEQDEFNAIESEVRESEQERSFIEYAATLIESVKERLEIDKQRGKTELSEFEEEVYKTINKRMEEARGSFEPTFGSGSLAEETIRAEGNQTLTCQRNPRLYTRVYSPRRH